MKNKKFFLTVIILAFAIVAIAAYSIISSIAYKPAITEGEFPFAITYELDGERVTIEDVYKVYYDRNDGYADSKTRVYVGKLLSSGENDTNYIIKRGDNTRVELWTRFFPDYLMGDPEGNYFETEAFEPMLLYYDADEQEFQDEETLAAQGVKLISFDYPTPIKNNLVFSHISYFSSSVVLPTLLIAIIAFIVTVIFVKKENELKYKAIDKVSVVLNCIVGSVYMIFVTILAMLIDMEGGGPELYYQIFYFIPAFSVLCISASVALRRKGYRISSLVTGLGGPVIFALYLVVFYVGGVM